MNIRTEKNRNGFTLIEAMFAVMVLAIAAAGVLLPFSSGAMVRAEGNHRTLGAKLAADLMEEIVKTPFESIVTTYNNYTELEGGVKRTDGVVFSGPVYSKLSRKSTCVYVYVPQESGDADSKYILATVRVYYNGKQIAAVRRLISK
jgi:prepilin-type N-terminal cleavage/methylation domain-containing protein